MAAALWQHPHILILDELADYMDVEEGCRVFHKRRSGSHTPSSPTLVGFGQTSNHRRDCLEKERGKDIQGLRSALDHFAGGVILVSSNAARQKPNTLEPTLSLILPSRTSL